MRALIEDIAAHAHVDGLEIREVGLPSTSARRDLWFQVKRVTPADAADGVYLRAFPTRTLARTFASTAYLASATVATYSAAEREITLTDVSGDGIVLNGLKAMATINAAPAQNECVVWGYTAAPDLMIIDDIRVILLTYVGTNLALEGIEEIYVGDPGQTQSYPCLVVLSHPPVMRDITTGHSILSMAYPITVQVGVNRLVSKQDSWRVCRQYLSQLDSILSDEMRDLYGGCRVNRDSVEGPAPVQGEMNPLLMAATLRLNAFVHPVWRDEEYPRS
jgi:hypothetical protein